MGVEPTLFPIKSRVSCQLDDPPAYELGYVSLDLSCDTCRSDLIWVSVFVSPGGLEPTNLVLKRHLLYH